MRPTIKIWILSNLIIGLFCFFTTVNAAPGGLDTSFSQDGKLVANIGTPINVSDYVISVILQPDGKIIALGGGFSNGNFYIITRQNTNGSLDASFGDGGKVFFPTATVADIALQADGKIVVVGSTNSSPYDMQVARLNSDGSFDTTFDGDGQVTTDFGGSEIAISVAIQPDGKIVAAGQTFPLTTADIILARYNVDGSLDTTFDGDGKVRTDIANNRDELSTLILQADGKILAIGKTTINPSNRDFLIIRYNQDGSLDTTFDNDGKLTTDFFGSYDDTTSAALQADGKIVVLGTAFSSTPPSPHFVMARYNANGSLDTTFDGDGKVLTIITGSTSRSVKDIALQSDGKIVLVGYVNFSGPSGANDLIVFRFNTDGSLDTTFDGDGYVITDVSGSIDEANSVVIQTDGKILVAGSGYQPSLNQNDFEFVRYNSDSSLDISFGTGGKIVMNVGVAYAPSEAQAVAVQPDGKIVFVGWSGASSNRNFAVVRYLPNGSPDTAFDSDGQLTTDFLGNSDQAFAVAVQADGKIVAAGYASNGTNEFIALARYNSDGSLDTSFDGDGKLTTNVLGSFSYANGVVVQPDGKIVVGGYAYNGANSLMAIVRYNPNGSLDTSFNGSGQVVASISGAGDEAYAVALQPDGKIVATGSSYNGTSYIFSAIRCNPNGSLDTTFDGDGRLTTDLPSTRQGANAVFIQTDGKIVVAGTGDDNINRTVALVRYNPNGSLDTTFDGDGRVMTGGAIADAATIQSDGKIVVGGSSGSDFIVLRYNTDGSLDNSFGTGGKSIFDISGGFSDRIYGAAVDSNGKIVVAGASNNFLAAARVLGDSAGTRTRFDFDGDGKSDVSVFRPSSGIWYLQQSTNGFTGIAFGQNGDKLAPADYDGDGKTDLAVIRNGFWYIQRSSRGFTAVQFGDGNDIPVPADYDGDGKDDVAVFRPSNGTWYLLQSTAGFGGIAFGQNGDKPVPADYDGDGKADIAVNRGGTWYLNRSQLGFYGVVFGEANDKVVPGDYTGDGRADIAVFRPSNGNWYILRSEDFSYYGIHFGQSDDIPTPGDYDGDGKLDQAVFRPASGNWYLNRSTSGFTGLAFGFNTDTPVPSVFVP